MTSQAEPSERHLSLDSFEEYLRHGVPIEHPIRGEPRLLLLIDPQRPEIGLRVPCGPNDEPQDTGLEHVEVRIVHRPAGRHLEVTVTDSRLFIDAYPLLCAVADRIQLQGLSFNTALSDTVRLLGRLLERSDALSMETELGLFGELLLFLGLLRTLETEEVVAAWHGPDSEEHDFGLRGLDIEVKTTNAERRTHWISSLTQLVPNLDRPLWLVSHQLTKAGPDDGRRLADVIETVREAVGADTTRDRLERNLYEAGWRDEYKRTCRTRWRRRAASAAYAVTGDFPRLDPALLTLAKIDLIRVPEVRYKIDLTDRGAGAVVPNLLAAAISSVELI